MGVQFFPNCCEKYFTMPKRRLTSKVPNLECICIRAVSRSILSIADATIKQPKQYRTIKEKDVDNIRNLLECIPPAVFINVAKDMLETAKQLIESTKEKSKMKNQFVSKLLAALFNSHLKECDSQNWPKEMRHVLMHSTNSVHLSGLKILTLNFDGFENYCGFNIVKNLRKMNLLQSLFIPVHCTDSIVATVAKYCPQIKNFDFINSNQVTNGCVPKLVKCQTLIKLNLVGTSITLECIAGLLIGLPKLEEIGNVNILQVAEEIEVNRSWNHVPLSLKKIALANNCCNSRFDLYDNKTASSNKYRKLFGMFAFTENLSADLSNWNKSKIGTFFTIVTCLKKLKEFKLSMVEHFENTRLRPIWSTNLNKVSLHFNTICLNTIMDIGHYCPNLKELDVKASLIKMEKNEIPEIPCFLVLERLTLVGRCESNCLAIILKHAVNIKSVKSDQNLRHDWIVDIFKINSMKELEELEIVRPDQSTGMNSIVYIMGACNELKTLRGLDSWKGITQNEVIAFKESVRTSNYDLEVPYDEESHLRVLFTTEYRNNNVFNLFNFPNFANHLHLINNAMDFHGFNFNL